MVDIGIQNLLCLSLVVKLKYQAIDMGKLFKIEMNKTGRARRGIKCTVFAPLRKGVSVRYNSCNKYQCQDLLEDNLAPNATAMNSYGSNGIKCLILARY